MRPFLLLVFVPFSSGFATPFGSQRRLTSSSSSTSALHVSTDPKRASFFAEPKYGEDVAYYEVMESLPSTGLPPDAARVTLTRFLSDQVRNNPELVPLQSLLLSVQMACKTIANLINRAGLVAGTDRLGGGIAQPQQQDALSDGRYYSMKRLDQVCTRVLRNALRFTGKVNLITPVARYWEEKPAEHQPGVLIASALDSSYVAVLDPLDGSGNADASICTGTVFGVFQDSSNPVEEGGLVGEFDESEQDTLVNSVLQPGKNMKAAGYCFYSSATVLVYTLGDGNVNGFTLDPALNEFVLTHANLTIPSRGNVYSCNEANSEGWGDEIKDYLRALKTGDNEAKHPYAHRYVGSMVGDIHRTLLYGGIFFYPSDSTNHPKGNLQLLYKSAPMAFVINQAGGKALDENCDELLNVQPERVHQKSPCFIGSPQDVDEIRKYLEQALAEQKKTEKPEQKQGRRRRK